MKLRDLFLTVGLLGVYGAGCVIEVARSPYEPCNAGDACSSGTVCQAATVTTNGSPANVCTVSCTPGSSCPTTTSGLLGLCVLTGSRGQCMANCRSDADCSAFSSRCVTAPGSTALVCAPIGSGTAACGASGQTCCSGNTCGSGLSCVSGTCQVPCGASGQACCGGSTCGTGLSCVSNVCQALPVPYQTCTPVGAQCAGGATCMTAQARAPGMAVGNFCSAACPTGLASSCPGFVAGQVECVNLPGDMPFQCMRLCTTANDCTAFGTQCLEVVSKTGNTIRVCAP